MYDELFVMFNDALDGVRAESRAASKDNSAKAASVEGSLAKLSAYLVWNKLHNMCRQKLLLVRSFVRALADGPAERGADKVGEKVAQAKRATPEDIVRLYESVSAHLPDLYHACVIPASFLIQVIASLVEMQQLDGYKEDEALVTQVAARLASAKASRCFYLAETYRAAARWREAQALYSRAAELMVDAMGQVPNLT